MPELAPRTLNNAIETLVTIATSSLIDMLFNSIDTPQATTSNSQEDRVAVDVVVEIK